MNNDDFYSDADPEYLAARNQCMTTRKSIIEHEGAIECAVSRLDSSSDLEEDEYKDLGYASICFHGKFNDKNNPEFSDALSSLTESEQESLMVAQLVSMADPESLEEFTPELGDLVWVFPGGGIVIGYEIIEVIDLFNCRYLLLPDPALQTIPGVNA